MVFHLFGCNAFSQGKNKEELVPLISQHFCSPLICQPPEAPGETKEPEQTAAEVKAESNGKVKLKNGLQDDEKKKKLNKRERKEARQQKSGKAVKGADKAAAAAQEPGEGKTKKKDRKRKHASEEDEEQNGADDEKSSKKSKTSTVFPKEMLLFLQSYLIQFFISLINLDTL